MWYKSPCGDYYNLSSYSIHSIVTFSDRDFWQVRVYFHGAYSDCTLEEGTGYIDIGRDYLDIRPPIGSRKCEDVAQRLRDVLFKIITTQACPRPSVVYFENQDLYSLLDQSLLI